MAAALGTGLFREKAVARPAAWRDAQQRSPRRDTVLLLGTTSKLQAPGTLASLVAPAGLLLLTHKSQCFSSVASYSTLMPAATPTGLSADMKPKENTCGGQGEWSAP